MSVRKFRAHSGGCWSRPWSYLASVSFGQESARQSRRGSCACPRYSDSDQIAAQRRSAALCQKRTNAAQQNTSLFDHLVGAQHETGRNLMTDGFGGPEIDDQLVAI